MLYGISGKLERSIIMYIRENVVIKENDNRYSKAFLDPVIPDGYRHITGTDWKSGFQIERIEDGSRFVFIPVGSLKSNGTLDGINFNEKFGRRVFYPNFSNELGEEPIYGTRNLLRNQFQSVVEYGGFYVSSIISRSESLKPISIPGRTPWTMIDFERAMSLAMSFENRHNLSSHLIFGAEYDSIIEWIIESNKMTLQEVVEQNFSEDYGKPYNGNVLSLGRVAEWTQERTVKGTSSKPAIRGVSLKRDGTKNPLAWRQQAEKYVKMPYIGFRIALYIPAF